MRKLESKVVPLKDVSKLAEKWRAEGKRIVTTNGCFDLLHLGHIRYLQEARSLGDVLLVGLNSDKSVKGLKGENRPLFPENIRALQLAGLESVDCVTIFSEPTPEELLQLVRPAVHVKGGDYRPEDLPEKKVVEKHGGKVHCVSLVEGFSTTKILERLKE
jgi:rfaE bifunctional protein nucleotidyltransferase chain/domain